MRFRLPDGTMVRPFPGLRSKFRKMKEEHKVETIEEFKQRIAAIRGGVQEHIEGARPTHPMLLRPKKRKAKRR